MDKDILRWFLMDALLRPVPKRLIAATAYFGHLVFKVAGRATRSTILLMTAHRLHSSELYVNACVRSWPAIKKCFAETMKNDVSLDMAVDRSIIIRMPVVKSSGIVRGIFIITFTDTFRYYFHNVNISLLQKYFHVVLEPSWAGYCLPEVLFWAEENGKVFVQATEAQDRYFLNKISGGLIPVGFGASDWVNYKKFYPLESEKKYDSIYVANYTHIKRLHVYFRALKDIKKIDHHYRAAIVCASWGENRGTVFKLIERYKIGDILDVKEDLNVTELNKVLNKAKCNILLSLKEGSNRSLFEAMFSNVPVIALKNNIGVNKDYINDATGMLVDERSLVSALLEMKNSWQQFEPNGWAMNNISPEVTTRKLVKVIEQYEGRGDICKNVAIKTNDPEVAYFENNNIDKNYYVKHILKIFANGSGGDVEESLRMFSDEFNRELTMVEGGGA